MITLLDSKLNSIKLVAPYEVFALVTGTNRFYISSYGRFLEKTEDGCKFRQAKTGTDGYLRVSVQYIGDKHFQEKPLAILVADAFLPPASVDDYAIWFKDNNPMNCQYKNLFWVTEREALEILCKKVDKSDVVDRQKYISLSNFNNTKLIQLYHDMLRRCDDEEYISRNEDYRDCTVCEEWREDMGQFFEWVLENYYWCSEGLELDKDILSFDERKCYSPDTCIFVPHWLNMLFRNVKNETPGITVVTNSDGTVRYRVFYSSTQKNKSFVTMEEAQEEHIKDRIATIEKAILRLKQNKFTPEKLIDALCKWIDGYRDGSITA